MNLQDDQSPKNDNPPAHGDTGAGSAQEEPIAKFIVDNATAVIYTKDRYGKYQFINRRYADLFGISLTEIRGKTDFDVFPAEQAIVFVEHDQAVWTANEAIEFEEIARHADGVHTYLSLKFPVRDEQGEPIGICGISTDITPRKKLEVSLQESDLRFRQLAESVRECFWITDIESGQIVYVSQAYEDIWGRSRESLYENPRMWIEAIHPADRDRTEQAFHANDENGTFYEEYRVVRPDGSIRWISDRRVAIHNEAGAIYRLAGMAEDVTERRHLETQVAEISSHERHRISRELHDSVGQQLTGLGFLAKSLVRRLAERVPAEAQMAETILDGIQDAIAEVRRVVRGLAPVHVDEYGLKTALRELAESTSKRFLVDCQFHSEADIAVTDNNAATELYRIAQEATMNAIKHAQPTRVTIDLDVSDQDLVLRVRDDGHGMVQSDGDGMGMKIMRYRSKMIGADLTVDSSATGTTVICKLVRDIKRE